LLPKAGKKDAPVVIAIHGFRGHIIGKAGKTITALRETGCTVGIYGRDSAEYVIVSGTQDERDVVCERIAEIVRMQQEIRARETEVTARVTEQQKPSEVKEISARRTVPGYSKPSVESLRPECGYLDTVEKPYVVGNGVEETRGDGWNLQGKEKVKKVKVKKSKPVEEVSVVEEKKQEIKQETILEPKPQKIRNKVIDVSPLQASPTKLQPPPPAPVQTLHTQIPTPIITKPDPLPESEWTQISSKPKSARQQPAKVVQGVRSELEERAIALGMDTATPQKKKKKKVKKTVEV
jgi:KH domain